MIIAVDFDGTCVTHEYPNMGKDIGAEPILKALVASGHKIILLTMRDSLELEDAVKWFSDREIPLFGINDNPEQYVWTSSPKVYAQLYIDAAALGCPLIHPVRPEFSMFSSRPYVNWSAVAQMLGVFSHDQT